jgi:hypothetical protein
VPALVVDHGRGVIVDDRAGEAGLLERQHRGRHVQIAAADEAFGEVRGGPGDVAEVDVDDPVLWPKVLDAT